MTVAELIEALSELPQHHLVMIRTFDKDAYEIVDRNPSIRQHTTHDGPWVTL